MTEHTIGTIEEFPEGEGTRVVVDGIDVAVFNVDGELYAIANRCPHKNLPLHLAGHDRFESAELLADGQYLPEDHPRAEHETGATRGRVTPDDLTIHCPWHFLEWDLETGHNPVRDHAIPTFDVTVEDDEVTIEL